MDIWMTRTESWAFSFKGPTWKSTLGISCSEVPSNSINKCLNLTLPIFLSPLYCPIHLNAISASHFLRCSFIWFWHLCTQGGWMTGTSWLEKIKYASRHLLLGALWNLFRTGSLFIITVLIRIFYVNDYPILCSFKTSLQNKHVSFLFILCLMIQGLGAQTAECKREAPNSSHLPQTSLSASHVYGVFNSSSNSLSLYS